MLNTVKVPEKFTPLFRIAQDYVSKYFAKKKHDPAQGTIEIFDERYILVRAASMSVEFFETVKGLYKDVGEEEATTLARQLLFDIAHAIGRQDAKNFHEKMKLKSPVERLSAGPVHFAHSGWAFVDIFPESKLSPDEDYYLIYDHPFSFESDAWLKAGKTSGFPVCVMNAGYSSGWCEESFGVTLVASEIMCKAHGDEACRFIMAPPNRIQGHIEDYLKKSPELQKKVKYEIPGFFVRKKMERDLRMEKERARHYLDIAGVMLVALDKTGTVTLMNKRGAEILGCASEEIEGKNWFEHFIPEEDRPQVREVFQRLMKREEKPIEYFENRVLTRSGGMREIAWHNRLLRNEHGEVIGTLSSGEDITEKNSVMKTLNKQTEELRERVKEMRCLTQALSVLSLANRPIDQIMEFILAVIPPGWEHPAAASVRITIEGKSYQSPSFEDSTCIHRMPIQADGSPIGEIVISCGPEAPGSHSPALLDRKMRLLETLAREIAEFLERKHAEEELKASREQLYQSQKLEAVGRLAGGIAHDFNNLLTSISGCASFLLDSIPKGDNKREDVEEIKMAGERAAALTRQLLAFSRKQVMQPKILNLNALISGMEKLFRRTVSEDIELILSLRPAIGAVKADASQLEQVLLNLVVNAQDAMPKGGKLILETSGTDLCESASHSRFTIPAGRYVLITVSDTGVGMGADTLEHVFEPFFTTKEVGKGTGLGLATAYGIIRQSGGYASVYSEPGKGTTFRVYLPREEEEPDESAGPEHPLGEVRGSETVLLVEDDAIVRRTARRILANCGYRLLEARSPSEALKLIKRRKGPIQLLVTDVVMPGMDGRELAKLVRAELPGIRTLYMSGYADEVLAHNNVLEPGSAFIEKPFAPHQLAARIRRVLDDPA